jgi:hypothetical protein
VVTLVYFTRNVGGCPEKSSLLFLSQQGPWKKPNLRKGSAAVKVHPYWVDSVYTPRLIKIELKDILPFNREMSVGCPEARDR